MKKYLWLLLAITMHSPAKAQQNNALSIGLVLQPYTARTGADEFSIAPQLLLDELSPLLREWQVKPVTIARVDLTEAEKQQYGVWHHLGLADGHLGRAVSGIAREEIFVLGLLGNCNSSLGMLAGLQQGIRGGEEPTLGLIWVDAHGDFNTPETTLSGWLGGMPVAVAAGQCLHRLRLKAGLAPPVATENIVMIGLRDVDPLEQELIDAAGITVVPANDMVQGTEAFRKAVASLAAKVDVIYLHIDLDILDATDIPGSFFEVTGGPLATELVAPVTYMVAQPKVKALGISSFPTREEGRQKSLQSAMLLIKAGIAGLRAR